MKNDGVLDACKKAFDCVIEGNEPWKAEDCLPLFVHNSALTKEEQEELAEYTAETIRQFRRNLLKVECIKKLMGEGKDLKDIGYCVAMLGREKQTLSGTGAQISQQQIFQQQISQKQISQQRISQEQIQASMDRFRGLGSGM